MRRNSVSADYLLKGSVYALEQCGFLLQSAMHLFEHHHYSASIVLALFGREELGRSAILRNLWKDVVMKKRSVTLRKITKDCAEHLVKQTFGHLTTHLQA